MFGVAHNILRTYYRKRRRKEDHQIDFAEASIVDLGAGPATVFGHKREMRVLLEALRRIPLDDQVLLQLKFFEQFSDREIAEHLGVPRGTAVGRIRKARKLLHQAVREGMRKR